MSFGSNGSILLSGIETSEIASGFSISVPIGSPVVSSQRDPLPMNARMCVDSALGVAEPSRAKRLQYIGAISLMIARLWSLFQGCDRSNGSSKEKKYPGTVSILCNWCEYQSQCPLWKEVKK